MSGFSRRLIVLMFLVLMGSAVTSNTWAQVDFSGTWYLNTQTVLPDTMDPCVFSGTAIIIQAGNELSGTASLRLTSGPGACPTEMTANVSGAVRDGEAVLGLLLGGQMGEAEFFTKGAPEQMQSATGSVSKTKASSMSIGGSFFVTSGPYMGLGGPWDAMMAARQLPVPTLAFYGSLLLVMVLVTIGGFSLRRRRLHH